MRSGSRAMTLPQTRMPSRMFSASIGLPPLRVGGVKDMLDAVFAGVGKHRRRELRLPQMEVRRVKALVMRSTDDAKDSGIILGESQSAELLLLD
jgi:hypothetical protein